MPYTCSIVAFELLLHMKALEILANHQLKRTSCREGIIEVMLSTNHALSEHEIRDSLVGNYDRTTFYRSFKTLEEHKIIHRIIVGKELVKYAIDQSVSLRSEHPHFYCHECHSVKCIEDVPALSYNLPVGYSNEKIEVLIKGTCSICSGKKDS